MLTTVGLYIPGRGRIYGVLHDKPTVAVSAPAGTVSTGGPSLTASWLYSQAQGHPQSKYRVLFTDSADTVTYYDSGWLYGTDATHTVNFDDEQIPADTTDIACKVQVQGQATVGVGVLEDPNAEDVSPFAIEWGVPHCTVLSPVDGQIITDPNGVTVQWSFSDDRAGKTQGQYRVMLRLPSSGTVLYDTGWVVDAAATSHVVDYYLADKASYDIVVQLKNNEGIRSD